MYQKIGYVFVWNPHRTGSVCVCLYVISISEAQDQAWGWTSACLTPLLSSSLPSFPLLLKHRHSYKAGIIFPSHSTSHTLSARSGRGRDLREAYGYKCTLYNSVSTQLHFWLICVCTPPASGCSLCLSPGLNNPPELVKKLSSGKITVGLQPESTYTVQ